MMVIKQSLLVPYSAHEMYELVNAIEYYPEFLPWCKASHVHHRDCQEVQATLEVSKGFFHHSFTTLNRLIPPQQIQVKLLQGPLRHLEGHWNFDEIDELSCQVSFNIEFEFANKLIGLAVGPFLDQLSLSLVEALCQRARKVYG